MQKIKAVADSARTDSLKPDSARGWKPDSAFKSRVDSLNKLPAYEPPRVDVTIRSARDVPRASIVLRGARVVSMKAAEVIERGDVGVTNSRIARAAATATCPVAA